MDSDKLTPSEAAYLESGMKALCVPRRLFITAAVYCAAIVLAMTGWKYGLAIAGLLALIGIGPVLSCWDATKDRRRLARDIREGTVHQQPAVVSFVKLDEHERKCDEIHVGSEKHAFSDDGEEMLGFLVDDEVRFLAPRSRYEHLAKGGRKVVLRLSLSGVLLDVRPE